MAITALLGDIAAVVKGKRPGQVNIDSKVFQLHYRATTFLLLACSILSTTNSLIGNPMNCVCGDCSRAGISKDVINTHCWVSGTYTLPAKTPESNQRLGIEAAFEGIGTQQETEERKYHLYYQWVPFALFMQGILFYIPHWMWEINEDGRVHALVHHLRMPNIDRDELKKKIGNLTMYVTETLGSYDGYYLRFVLCDALNIVNVIANLVFTDRFINSEFMTYGPRCIHYFQNTTEINPMTVTFPKISKCTFQTFGVSGTVQRLDAICVLANNIFNEKVYLVLWFWLVSLSILTSVLFVFRLIGMLTKRMRTPMFQRHAHTTRTGDIDDVVQNIKVGDFFFLSLIAKNLDITAFRMFLQQLAKTTRRRRQRGRRPSKAGEALLPPRSAPAAAPPPAARDPSPARLRV